MAWTRTYDIDTPANDDDPAEADDRMREIKFANQEREDVDHYWPLTGSEVSDLEAGEHRKATIRTLTAIEVAALAGAKAYLYRLVTDGELYFKDATGNTIKLTSGGKILSASLDIKNEDNMVSDSDTHAATQQSIKAYADAVAAAAAAAVAAAHPAYAGGESHTDGSGLITKMGRSANPIGDIGAGSITITFDTPFPNACKSAVASLHINTASQMFWFTDNPSTTGFIFRWFEYAGTHNLDGFDWIAIGY